AIGTWSPSRTIATASRRNSGGYFDGLPGRRFFLLDMDSSYMRCPPNGGMPKQAKALGDPTRHAIFRHIAQAGRAVGVAELTDQFPFNHNAIRQHLAKLVAADLVVETTAPAVGRGRPRLVYEIN